MFQRVSKHSKTIKELGLRPRAFICFLVFGNPDETRAFVFEILRNMRRCVVLGCVALRSLQQTQITRERNVTKLNRFKVISIENFNLLRVEHGVCIAIVAASCRHFYSK